MADEQGSATSPADAGGAAAEARLAAAVREIFGSACRSAWLSGSFVYGGAQPGESDIDVVVVLDAASVPADGDTLARIRRFVDVYLEVHAEAGLDPDLDFPGEYVVPAALDEAIAWRGIATEGRVARELPPPDAPDYWIGRPDRWFNAWLSMTAFTRFLAGDPFYHDAQKLAAWTTIARFLLLRSGGGALAEEELWPDLAQFGVKSRYHALRPLEEPCLRRALALLEREGVLTRDDGLLVPAMEPLRAWERRLAAAIAAEPDAGAAPLLLPPDLHREIGRHAKARWVEVAGQ